MAVQQPSPVVDLIERIPGGVEFISVRSLSGIVFNVWNDILKKGTILLKGTVALSATIALKGTMALRVQITLKGTIVGRKQ